MNEKKRYIVILIVITLISLTGCMSRKTEIISEEDTYVGTYCFDSPNDTADQLEDHYIVLLSNGGNITGYYYGTSDDFDMTREGYTPGFFVTEMKDLVLTDNELNFNLQLFSKDIFSKPVELQYSLSEDVPIDKNPPWINAHIFNVKDGLTIDYSGTLRNDEIVIIVNNETRTFKKMEANK